MQWFLPVGQICCCPLCMRMKLLNESRTRPKQCDPEAVSWQALCIVRIVALQGRLHFLPTDPCEEKVGNVRKPRSTMEMTAISVWGATSAPSAQSCFFFFKGRSSYFLERLRNDIFQYASTIAVQSDWTAISKPSFLCLIGLVNKYLPLIFLDWQRGQFAEFQAVRCMNIDCECTHTSHKLIMYNQRNYTCQVVQRAKDNRT